MTRKVKISFMIMLWSIVAIQMFVNNRERVNHQKQTVTAFSVISDTEFSESINGYGFFGRMDISERTKKEMLENLAYKLGITEGYDFNAGGGDGYTKLVLKKNGANADTTLQLISVGTGEPEQYIVIGIDTRTDLKRAQTLFQKVKRVYKEIGVDGNVSMEMEIVQDGNIAGNAESLLLKNILKVTEAKWVDIINENGICTLYGYTKLEDSYVTLNKQKVNLQIAMNYDENEDKTHLKIGIPLVNSPY